MGASLMRNINEIDIDTDVVNIGRNQISNTNIKTPIEVEHSKLFVVYQKDKEKKKLKVINVKMIESSLFVYITDVDTHETNLLHVARLAPFFTPDNTLQHVQLSRDFKYIALPEEQSINIYNISNFTFVNNVDIKLAQHKGAFTFSVDAKPTNSPKTYFDLSSTLSDRDVKLHRCILFDKAYVIIFINRQMIAKFVFLFYTEEERTYEMLNFDVDLTQTFVRFSYSGRYMLLYDTVSREAKIYDIYSSIGNTNGLDNIPPLHTITIPKSMHSIINISDDAQFVLCANTEGAVHIIDINKEKTFNFAPNTLQHVTQNRYIILHFCSLVADQESATQIYVLLGWNKVNLHVTCSVIMYAKESYSFLGPVTMKITLSNDPIYTYSNGTIFVFRTLDGLAIFDVHKLLPVRVANLLASRIKLLITPDTELESHFYFNNVHLIGTDGSAKIYHVHKDAHFLLDMKKKSASDKFMLGFASNINIVDDLQSFTVFIGIMSGCIKQKEIINKLFSITKATDRHTMTYTLVEHLIEYIKIFITGANKEIRQQFAIYVVCILVFRYYIRLIDETRDEISINRNLFDLITNFTPCLKDFCKMSATMILDL